MSQNNTTPTATTTTVAQPNMEEPTLERFMSSSPDAAEAYPTKLPDLDKLALDLAKEKKNTAAALAREAMARSEAAELSYRYTILSIYYKLGLKPTDALSEDGAIVKDGAQTQQG
jgi:hypothetical protein